MIMFGSFELGINIETACFLSALFNIVTALDGVVVAIICLATGLPILTTIYAPWVDRATGGHNIAAFKIFFEKICPPALLIISLVSLAVSSLLIAGLIKKKSGFVKAFFIAGVIAVSISLGMHLFALQVIVSFNNAVPLDGINRILLMHLGLLILHAFIMVQLVFAHKTFKKFQSPEIKQFIHTPLENEGIEVPEETTRANPPDVVDL